jgi:hypothetical protein
MRRISVLLLLAGCAAPSTVGHWLDTANLPRATGKEGYAAVVLYKSDRLEIYPSFGRFEYTDYRHHEAIQVLKEGGIDRAEVRVLHPEDSEITELRARSIDPDGTVHELDAKAVLEEVAYEDVENRLKVKAWRAPGVKVGSIVEWAYTVRYKASLGQWDQSVADAIPVREYEAEIRLGGRARYALRTYNAADSFTRDQDGDFVRFRWSAKDVPAVEDDGLAPHWSMAGPWWVYRTKQEVYGETAYDYNNDWADVCSWDWAKLAPSSDLYDTPAPAVGLHCADATCRIQEALAETRKVQFRKGGQVRDARKISEIITSGWATTGEKTLLLLRALRAAGLEAQPAFVTTPHARRVDERFPWSGAWNRVLVLLPQQTGIEKPMWIDPLCETCGPGQIPGGIAGSDARVLDAKDKFDRNDDIGVRHLQVEGETLPPAAIRDHYRIELDPQGKTVVHYSGEHTGSEGMWLHARSVLLKESDREKNIRDWVTARVATARVRTAPPLKCDFAQCEEQVEFDCDDLATIDGDRMLVPLKVLRTPWDARFVDKERHSDIVVLTPLRYEEDVAVQIPPGYRVAQLPESLHAEAPALDVDVQVETTADKVVVRRILQQKVGAYGVDTYKADQKVLISYRDVSHALVVLEKDPPRP